MTRKVLFQIHWLLGITAGLVLAVMGVTGAMMSFQDELMAAFSPKVVGVTASSVSRLEPSALMAVASAQHQGQPVAALVLDAAADHAAQVEFAPTDPRRHHGDRSYINPYTGQLLGLPHGAAFFLSVRNLHRYLLLPGDAGGIGRPITGISTFALIFFALSGLYLRWPRKPLDWRNWLTLDLRRRGRDLYRQLHAVIGAWLVVLYLLSALTGLWWSFEFYRGGLTRMLSSAPAATMPRRAAEGHGGGRDGHGGFRMDPGILDASWQRFRRAAGPDIVRASVMLPRAAKGQLVIRALDRHARYGRMTDDWSFAADDGHLVGVRRYRTLATGDLILGHILPIHDGSFFGLPGRVLLLLSSLSMPLFTVTGLLLYIGRRRQKRRLRAIALPAAAGVAMDGPLIIYASQAGHAERLARLTAQAFHAQGQMPRLLALNNWQPGQVHDGQLCLFVVSTYGEGEPPDQGRLFAKSQLCSAIPRRLPALEFAVLALGDRLYPDFCAFGRQLDTWLEQSGGRRAFPMLALDGDSPAGLQQWQRQLRRWGVAATDHVGWGEVPWQRWRLLERSCLNPGSPEHPAYWLRLAAVDAGLAQWTVGDLVEILPVDAAARMPAWLDRLVVIEPRATAADGSHVATTCAGAATAMEVAEVAGIPELKPREYSIASIQAQGEIQLLVRQVRHADGSLGVCSGWLTEGLEIGDTIPLRIRCNPGFHPPSESTPLILIGSGTGLAGLLAHLRARVAVCAGDNWLVFGERHAGSDDFFEEELRQAQQDGFLQRLDRVYSRDGQGPRYVQDQLQIAAADLLIWVERGAAIYVCGSLHGMATDVDLCLRGILGSSQLDALSLAGRYRRDVY